MSYKMMEREHDLHVAYVHYQKSIGEEPLVTREQFADALDNQGVEKAEINGETWRFGMQLRNDVRAILEENGVL